MNSLLIWQTKCSLGSPMEHNRPVEFSGLHPLSHAYFLELSELLFHGVAWVTVFLLHLMCIITVSELLRALPADVSTAPCTLIRVLNSTPHPEVCSHTIQHLQSGQSDFRLSVLWFISPLLKRFAFFLI